MKERYFKKLKVDKYIMTCVLFLFLLLTFVNTAHADIFKWIRIGRMWDCIFDSGDQSRPVGSYRQTYYNESRWCENRAWRIGVRDWTDEDGILTKVNLIVGTTNNYAPIAMSIKNAASALITKGTVITNGLLNRVEMAFRSYDPCFGCATHTLPGNMPLEVVIRDADGNAKELLSQHLD